MITRNQLAFYGDAGERIENFDFQPPSSIFLLYHRENDRLVVQLVGNRFEVYDLRTIKLTITGSTIGLPVAEHEDYDTAVMTALLTQ